MPPLDIASLGRRAFISQSALADVLAAVKASGEVPETTSKSTVKRRRVEAADVNTPYGKLIQEFQLHTVSGDTLKLHFVHPGAFLHYASMECSGMQTLLDKAWQGGPNVFDCPWTIILYLDEISPGNQLKVTNKRKIWAIYYSVKQFGGFELSQESSWMILTVIRSETAGKIKGGMSAVFLECLKMFCKPNGCLETGIRLQIMGDMQLCFFKVGYLVADEAAIKVAMENKGASGKMMCLFCQTTVQARYAPANLGQLVLHHEHDITKLCLHSDESIWQIVDHLDAQAGHGTKKAFQELEMKLGFNHCPGGVLLAHGQRERWRPISFTCFDPMHVFFVSGVFHREMTYMLDLLSRHGVKQQRIHAWCATFTWPKLHRSAGKTALDALKKKRESGDDFKCSASDALALYPIIRAFFQHMDRSHLNQDCMRALHSFFALCEVLDDLKHVATGSIDPTHFRSHIETHLQAFKVSRPHHLEVSN
eukprot:Skav201323  [mRNA]  locus=scaffold4795:9662:11098:+ [translate_table: standard]